MATPKKTNHITNLFTNIDWTVVFLCFSWYLSSALKHSFSKEFLSLAPLPVTSSFLETFFTVLCTFGTIKLKGSFGQNQQNLVAPSWNVLQGVLPLCISTVIGHTLTQISLEFIAVSYTHTIKSISPLFTMIMSYFILGETFSLNMGLSIVPIVTGVLLSSVVEMDINVIGTVTALLSSVCFCYTNIYSKIMVENKKLDSFHLLMYNNCGSTILLFLLAYVTEWSSFADFTNAHLVQLNARAYTLVIAIGFFHFLQSITAISFLTTVSPLSYSIANTFKRVFVIILSIIYFGNVVTPLNYVGIFISIVGILLYNRANILHKASLSTNNIRESGIPFKGVEVL